MFNPPPPPPQPPVVIVQRKRGMGCFGIGCIVLLIALLLLGGLIAGLSYFSYSKMGAMTSAVPATTPSFDGGDTVFQGAQQKIATFQQAQQQNSPASLELTADEINTLIARNPDLVKTQIHAFVTMSGNRMQVQASLPSNLIPFGLIKDRYFNGQADFSVSIDAQKNVNISLYGLKVGSEDVPSSQLSLLQVQLNSAINNRLQSSTETQQALSRIQTIEIRDGKLEIQTQ